MGAGQLHEKKSCGVIAEKKRVKRKFRSRKVAWNEEELGKKKRRGWCFPRRAWKNGTGRES